MECPKGFSLNLTANGRAAVICVWFVSLAAAAIWVDGKGIFTLLVAGVCALAAMSSLKWRFSGDD